MVGFLRQPEVTAAGIEDGMLERCLCLGVGWGGGDLILDFPVVHFSDSGFHSG